MKEIIISVSNTLADDFQKALRGVKEGFALFLTEEAFGVLVSLGYIKNHDLNRDPQFCKWNKGNFSGYTYSIISAALGFNKTGNPEYGSILEPIRFEVRELEDGTLIMEVWEGIHRSLFAEAAITTGFPTLSYTHFTELEESDTLNYAKKLSGFSAKTSTDPEAIKAFNLFKSCPVKFVRLNRDPNLANGLNEGATYKLREKIFNLLSSTSFYQFIMNYYTSKVDGFASTLGTSIGTNPRNKKTHRQEVRTFISNMLWVTSLLCGFHLDKNGKLDSNAAVCMVQKFNHIDNASAEMCAIYDRFCSIVNTPVYDYLFVDKGVEEAGRKHRKVHEARTINVAKLQAIIACAHSCIDDRLFADEKESTTMFELSDDTLTADKAAFYLSYATRMLDFMADNGEKLCTLLKTIRTTNQYSDANSLYSENGVGHISTNVSFGDAMARIMHREENKNNEA